MPSKELKCPAETVRKKKYNQPCLRRYGKITDVTLQNNRGRRTDGAFTRPGRPGGGWPPWGSW